MDFKKLGNAQRAREMARWFRDHMNEQGGGQIKELMASTALALEWEAFRLEREGGRRRIARRPKLIFARAA